MSDFHAGGADLDLAEKLYKIINLQADTALKNEQRRWAPWQVVITAASAGGVLAGAVGGLTLALVKWKVGG